MYRVDSATAVPTRPAPASAGTEGWFGDSTIVDQDIMNCMMGEIENAVIAAGLTPSKTDLTQLAQVFGSYLTLSGGTLTGPLLFGFNNLSADYSFVANDVGQTFNSAFSSGHHTWTLQANASVPIPSGARIYGIVDIGSSVTIATPDTLFYPQLNTAGNRLITAPSGSPVTFTLIKHASTIWVLECTLGVT